MRKKNTWTVEVDGVEHVIEYKCIFKPKLIVDGDVKVLKSKNIFVVAIDETINLGSKKFQLVAIGAKVDLAVNGIFLNSGKEYVPLNDLPKSTWIFVGICMLPLIVFGGGAINGAFGFLGAVLCIHSALSPNRSTAAKLFLNIVITTCVWLIDIIVLLTFISEFAQ